MAGRQSFVDRRAAQAARQCLGEQVTIATPSMGRLPFPDRSFDVSWAEASIYSVGFDTVQRAWRRLLAPAVSLPSRLR
ncbi:methyltransferase domain-containing protein [Salinactinospora qingdaonensis]|uniref:methyltransferase domain-containing protein n=1 Tax=Salinactinospora qingdaonensis TaxID=702744 RepID=UPI003CD07CBB